MKIRHIVLTGLAAVALVSCASTDTPTMGQAPTLFDEVRRATSRYADVAAATGDGYAPFLGCVSSPQSGAMGIHYVNGDLVGDGKLDPQRPEALMYEPKNGTLHFVGVEYIVLAAAWDADARVGRLRQSLTHLEVRSLLCSPPAFASTARGADSQFMEAC